MRQPQNILQRLRAFAPSRLRAFAALSLLGAASLLASPAQAEPFVAHKSGTMVLDRATGLIWQRCPVGQTWSGQSCTGTAKRFTFGALWQAEDEGNQQKLGGFDDWRVPTVRELASLLDCHGMPTERSADPDGGGAIKHWCDPGDGGPRTWNRRAFGAQNMDKPWFWSSSPSAGGSDDAWDVNFGNGYVSNGYRGASNAVRLVRASQSSGGAAALGFVTAIAADTEGRKLAAASLAKEKQEQPAREAQAAREYEAEQRKACQRHYPGKQVYIGNWRFAGKVYGQVLGVGQTRMTIRWQEPVMNTWETKEVDCFDYQ